MIQRRLRRREGYVAVGIRIAPYPPHGSVRAVFPHTALASGGDAQALQGIRMADAGRRQPAVDEPCHPLPLDTSSLAPSSQYLVPELAHGKTKVSESVPIARYSVVSDVPAHHGLQPRADFGDRVMHAPPQFGFHRLQLGLQLTSQSFCTSCSERVYITAIGCETGLSGARGLQAAGAGGL
jgi:hypothetical protein